MQSLWSRQLTADAVLPMAESPVRVPVSGQAGSRCDTLGEVHAR
jgi:hypothetical protein